MSVLPFLLGLDDIYHPHNRRYCSPSFDHHFGPHIHPQQLQVLLSAPERLRQSLSEIEPQASTDKGAISAIGKDGFQVNLDVQQFKPNEVTVKVQDNLVIIEGKHEERQDDHGFISRQFTRKYVLPKEIDANQLASSLSLKGILTVKAPLIKQTESNGERVIEIQQTGPARNLIKDNPQEQKKEEEKK